MKKFRFRLETVQRVRQVQHDIARGELLAANHAHAMASAVVTERATRIDTIATPSRTMSRDDFLRHRFAVDSAIAATEWAQVHERDAHANVLTHRAQWIETNTRLRAVERLRERAQAEHATAVRQDADRLSDEITTTRFRDRSTSR